MKGALVQDMLVMLLHALLLEDLTAGAGLLQLKSPLLHLFSEGQPSCKSPTQLPACTRAASQLGKHLQMKSGWRGGEGFVSVFLQQSPTLSGCEGRHSC